MGKELSRKLSGDYKTTANLKALMEKAKKVEGERCYDDGMRCFDEDEGSFHIEPILACRKVPEFFKDFYQLKHSGVYIAEQPFIVDLKAMPRS